jgi:hypothetical protein
MGEDKPICSECKITPWDQLLTGIITTTLKSEIASTEEDVRLGYCPDDWRTKFFITVKRFAMDLRCHTGCICTGGGGTKGKGCGWDGCPSATAGQDKT